MRGKWRRGSHNDKLFARSCLSIFREDGRRIVEVSREGFMPIEEAEANAQLIASAPDLYEACREMMERFNRGTRFPLQSTCDKMNQAIAKADGK